MPRCTIETWLLALLALLTIGCGLIDGEELEPMKSDRELALLAECREADDVATMTHKFAVCHTPPGDTRDPYTMLVSAQARDHHLSHGDTLGGCGCEDTGIADSESMSDDDEPAGSSEPGAVGSTGSSDYCDANQYRCEHNWGCPDQHVCDLGCCVYVIAWADSVDGDTSDDEATDEADDDDASDEPADDGTAPTEDDS